MASCVGCCNSDLDILFWRLFTEAKVDDSFTWRLLMAGRFKLNFKFNPRNAFLFGLGGLLVGFGSRFAKGCNIGALYSSIPNFSILGWVFLVAISLGAVVSLKIFEGGVSCLIPARHRDPEDFK